MKIRKIGNLAMLLAGLIVAVAARAELSASVDRTTVSEADLLTLTVRLANEEASGEPDFSALEKDFEIINKENRSSSSFVIENGRQTSKTHIDWVVTLRAKRQGTLTIPPIRLGNEKTQPITIKSVPASQSVQRRGDRPVFFDTSVDTDSTYVQGQVVYSVKLYYTEAISGDFPAPPKLNDAVVETLEKERRYESVVNGRRYYVLEKRYAIFPQKSGPLTIPPQTFTGTRSSGDGFFQLSRERVNAVSRAHTIKVKPRPASFHGDNWLPAKGLELSQRWSEDPPHFVVGEPVNRILTIKAIGVAGSLLPPFEHLDLVNAKTYKDPPETKEEKSDDGITATRTVTIGIVPTKAGTLRLPEIRIPWWNTDTDSLEEAVIPAATFQVAPAAGPQPAAPPSTSPAQPATQSGETGAPAAEPGIPGAPQWSIWAVVVLALAWIFSTSQWLLTRRDLKRLLAGHDDEPRAPAGPDEEHLFNAFRQACREGDPAAARRQLFLWAKARYPDIDSLQDLIPRAGQHADPLRQSLATLNRTLYAPEVREVQDIHVPDEVQDIHVPDEDSGEVQDIHVPDEDSGSSGSSAGSSGHPRSTSGESTGHPRSSADPGTWDGDVLLAIVSNVRDQETGNRPKRSPALTPSLNPL